MKPTLIVFLTIVCALFAEGQSGDEVDRLVKIIDQLDGKDRETVDSLNAIANDYSKAYPLLMVQFGEKAISISDELGYVEGKAQSYLNLSTIYRTRGDVTKALENGITAFSFYQELADSVQIANTFNTIANCYRDLGQLDSALTFLRKALLFNAEDLQIRGTSLNNIGSAYIDQDQYDSAEKYYKEALEIREEIRDLAGLGVTYGNMGIIAIQKGNDPVKANYWYDKSIQMKIDNRDFFNLAFTYINKGNLHRNIGEFELARKNYQIAVDIADSINANGIKASVYVRWARSERRAGNEQKALEYEQISNDIYIDVLRERQRSQLSQLEASYSLEKQKQQVVIQSQEISLLEKNRSLLLLQFSLATGLAIILFGLFWFQRIMRRREKELQEEKEARLTSELGHKNNELSLFTVNFIQKQQMMEEIDLLMKGVSKEKTVDGLKQKAKEIHRLVSNQQRSDKEWEDFKVYFEKVHHDFFQKVQGDFDDLTINELRLAALSKMNLSIKETASILGIAPDSVKTARSRLRTKLGLSRDQNLVNFLSGY